MIKNNRVLIVDDQEDIHKDFEEVLNYPSNEVIPDDLVSAFDSDSKKENFLPKFELLHARSGQEAYNIVKKALEDENPIAVIYMDVRMPPGWDGFETTRRIREIDKDVEVVIITAYNERPLSEIVNNIGLLHKMLYIRKPFAREEIQQITISLIEKWNVEKELAEKNRQLEISEQMLKKELKDALAKMLNGFLPICAECKKIRDDNGLWHQIDIYIQKHTDTKFTYSICPECTEKLYPTIYQRRLKMTNKAKKDQ